MSRPTGRDESVIRKAAELSLPEFKRWANEASGSDEVMLNDLLACIRWGHDGYARAKRIEIYGYEPDAELVEILDSIDVWRAEREAVAKWVKEFDVKAPFPIGALVVIAGGSGEIMAHDEAQGTSTVFVEAMGHVREGNGTHGLIVAWEKLKALEASQISS